MRLGIPDDSLKPTDSSEYKAYKLISDNFGEGYNGQIVMLVKKMVEVKALSNVI